MTIPEKALRLMRRGERRAKFLALLRRSYVFGGGHQYTTIPLSNRDFDCSSGVSHILQVMGFDCPTTDTNGLAKWGESGKGKFITIHVKHGGGLSSHEEHTILEFKHPLRTRFIEVGGYDNPKKGGGFTFFRPTAARLAEFNVHRHPKGF